MFTSNLARANYKIENTLEIDTSKTIRYVQMHKFHNYVFEGIRFLDADQLVITEKIWDAMPGGSWTELIEIPEGQQIIGLEVNTFNEQTGYINDMNFITGPIPDMI